MVAAHMNIPHVAIALSAFIALSGLVRAAESSGLPWPDITRESKPWSRWWWLGSIGDAKSFTSEMEKYAAAGLGGLEITPIYGVRGAESRFVPFLSSTWMANFQHVLAEGRRLGLGLDLATGTGWPFGGPWIEESEAAHYLAHRTYHVQAGSSLGEPVAFQQAGVIRVAGPRRVTLAELKQPVTANPNLQELALDQVRFEQPLPLVVLMATPEQGAPVDLTSQVGADGRLAWNAPTGQGAWTLDALFLGQHGKMVERAAPGGEGYALDHLSATALKSYLSKFDAAFSSLPEVGLRAFYNDSYEVDDAKGESDFTPGFLAEFLRRRGYDLRLHLRDLFADTPTETTARVLSDYRETVSDLLLENFTSPWRQWAAAHGALIRNQAHGSPANILDLYAASGIPEQEGTDLFAIKLASSAAHLTGQPLAAAETATWLNEHFLSTFAQLKKSVDTFLLAGINHNCYHGTAFSPPGEPWPGFQFYASVELNPQNPLWTDFTAFNRYVARAQSFLQAGRPDEDVLLYYNIHDRWMERGNGSLPHFLGFEKEIPGLRDAAVALRSAGVGFDYVSDRLLQPLDVADGMLTAGSQRYRALVVPATRFMPETTLAKLLALARKGATILVHRQLPADTPGLSRQRTEFQQLRSEIQKIAAVHDGITVATVDRGRLLVGDDLPTLLARCPEIVRETMGSLGLEFVRRRNQAGHFYFIKNTGTRSIDAWVPLHTTGRSAGFYDLEQGRSGLAAFRTKTAGSSEVYLQLAPGQACVVQLHDAGVSGPPWHYWQAAGQPVALAAPWAVTFTQGGPELPPPATVDTLASWTEWGGEACRAFSGTAVYTQRFPRPPGSIAAWQLDLGKVAESARVSLNGREVAVLTQAPWHVVLDAAELQADNLIEIAVTNLAANRIADLDRRGVPWKRFYNINMPARHPQNAGKDRLFTAADWTPLPSGLLGPVKLVPLRALVPE